MFGQLIQKVLSSLKRVDLTDPKTVREIYNEGLSLSLSGDKHAAIVAFRRFLEHHPNNVLAINELASCLDEVGNHAEAAELFLQAYALDDKFLPAIVNYARVLVDRNNRTEANRFLNKSKWLAIDNRYISIVRAAYLFGLGKTAEAKAVSLSAWMSNFEHHRHANWVMWNSMYQTGENEELLAGEHLFWAECLPQVIESPLTFEQPVQNRRLRIGYWSPDFREHSVRYFVRPLLEHHETDRVELHLYHDIGQRDAQTEALIAKFGEAFHQVGEMPDAELVALIRSQKLDILVELAGHTSHNRLPLLRERLAPLQINAIGYPSTTGLTCYEGKLLDRHIVDENAPRFYTEPPLALPTSLWCFDPMTDVEEPTPPPHDTKGFITFGCPGNINKVNEHTLDCWREILHKLPQARLLIRSFNFSDAMTLEVTRERFSAAGLPMNRVELLLPASGKDFFGTYRDIDIVLDTFPFNGGTTTAFALYMGVPVVSRYGQSLPSRMGLSMLTNMGAADLAVPTVEAYVKKALELAADSERLRLFRGSARRVFQSTALGDGAKFAREFEDACEALLLQHLERGKTYQHQVRPLPAQEIMRRAYTVRRFDQPEAVQRIVDHCLRHYPDTGSAHILWTDRLLAQPGGRIQARSYLLDRLVSFSPSDQLAAWAQIVRLDLLQNDIDSAEANMAQWERLDTTDPIDRAQARIMRLATDAARATPAPASAWARGTNEVGSVEPKLTKVAVLIPCDDFALFEPLKQQLLDACTLPAGWTLQIHRCREVQRLHSYRAWLANPAVDVLVLMQKNLHPAYPGLWRAVAQGLAHCDVVAMAGCAQWSRLDWRLAPYENKAAGLLVPCGEEPDFLEWLVQGFGHEPLHTGMAVLDGHFLAIRRQALSQTDFSDDASGAETLLEEVWIHQAGQNGARLGVHKGLGLVLNPQIVLDQSNLADARWATAERYSFEAFVDAKDDSLYVAAPLASADVVSAALDAMNRQSVAESGIAQN